MLFFSPLEQFSIFVVYPLQLGIFDLTISSVTLSMVVVFIIAVVTIESSLYSFFLFNLSIFQSITESFYNSTKSVMSQQTGQLNIPYVPLAFTIFLSVIGFNFVGLSAVTPTVTSQFVITASLAFSLNLSFLLLAFRVQGIQFFKFFVPKGIPVFLVPFMIIIEIFSYSIRSISLFVRLFANMMAGHTLMHIIGSFYLTVVLSASYYLAIIPFLLLGAIYILEIAIAFPQAYVFLTLSRTYPNDAINASHLHTIIFPV